MRIPSNNSLKAIGDGSLEIGIVPTKGTIVGLEIL
jgi:hypothetical protein